MHILISTILQRGQLGGEVPWSGEVAFRRLSSRRILRLLRSRVARLRPYTYLLPGKFEPGLFFFFYFIVKQLFCLVQGHT